MGTCLLRGAQIKIYLTASTATRAKRRYEELLKKGLPADPDQIEADIRERDYRDMHREIAPLKQAEDALLVDTSDMDIGEVVSAIRNIYEKVKEKA